MVPEKLARVEGPNLTLRLIQTKDADYVHALRTDPTYNRHLSEVRGTTEDQRRWIEGYKVREADLRELYYVIERKDGIRCGLVRLYDIGADSFTWGSWILDHNKTRKPDPKHVDIHALGNLPRPSKVNLDVGQSALFLMRRITDARGSLTVGEVPTEVPFSPARYFVVFDVPSMELRGEHAHKQCQQFLICLHGSCRVLLDDGQSRCEVTLDRPDMGVFMPEMIWGTQYRYSPDAVFLVFASRTYEAEDYLRTYDDFLAELERRRT